MKDRRSAEATRGTSALLCLLAPAVRQCGCLQQQCPIAAATPAPCTAPGIWLPVGLQHDTCAGAFECRALVAAPDPLSHQLLHDVTIQTFKLLPHQKTQQVLVQRTQSPSGVQLTVGNSLQTHSSLNIVPQHSSSLELLSIHSQTLSAARCHLPSAPTV